MSQKHLPAMRVASTEGKALPRRILLTGPVVSALKCPPGKDRVFVYDSKQAGLAVMVTAADSKAFYLYRKVHGRPQRIRIGGFPAITVEIARRESARLLGEIASGGNPVEKRRADRAKGVTLGDAFNWFLDNWAKPRKRSWRDDEGRYNNHLKVWAKRQLADITPQDVVTLHNAVADKTSKLTANRVRSLLSIVFNKARVGLKYPGENPCRGVAKFDEKIHERVRFLSAEDLGRFFEALDSGIISDRFADFFRMALYTGQRRGNVLSMRWDEIELSARTWQIPGSKFKTGVPLTVHLAEPALQILRNRKGVDPHWVFPGDRKGAHLKWPDAPWRVVCKAAKLTDVRIHDLRRTFGSWLAAGNVSLTIIGKTLGHRTPATTAIYARLGLESVRASVDAVAKAMEIASKGENKAASE